MIFEALAKQCLIMLQGSHATPSPGAVWQEIVHRDIKPHNIFVDIPTPGAFPKYPTVKMADFGLAFETAQGANNNPGDFQHAGTRRYKAPEQVGGNDQLLSHTNIWAIGMVMVALVNRDELNDQSDYTTPANRVPHPFTPFANSTYSADLLGLIAQCIVHQPTARITADNLLQAIQGAITDPAVVEWYTFQAARGIQDDSAQFEWRLESDYYRLDMAR